MSRFAITAALAGFQQQHAECVASQLTSHGLGDGLDPLGGILGGGSDEQLDALRDYGEAVGLAFQIVDDLLDVEETAETLGKTAGKDVAQGKLTYPSLYGLDAARARVARLLEEAHTAASRVGAGPSQLGAIAEFICRRRS